MGSEPQFAKYPDLRVAQAIFTLSTGPQGAQKASLTYLQNAIKEFKMAPLYRHLAHPTEGVLNRSGEGTADGALSRTQSQQPQPARRPSLVASNLIPPNKKQILSSGLLPWDESQYEELKKDNENELEDIQKEEDEAQEKAGETEVQAARSKRADFWARVGDKVG
jgi:26S proteasome regulatory subunit N7